MGLTGELRASRPGRRVSLRWTEPGEWRVWERPLQGLLPDPSRPSRPRPLRPGWFRDSCTRGWICLLSDPVHMLPFEFYQWNRGCNLDSAGRGTCTLVSLVWEALCSTTDVLYSQVEVSAKGPTPVYLKRKTNLYFVERAYCSPGVPVANFSGSFG